MQLLLDAMLGGLRSYLRMCGHDTAYALEAGVAADADLLALADAEDRCLITRDQPLGVRAPDAIVLTARETTAQLATLADAGIELSLSATPTRCSVCNGTLEPVPATAVTPPAVPDPAETAVWGCRACDQRFWKGSHWDRVAATLAAVE